MSVATIAIATFFQDTLHGFVAKFFKRLSIIGLFVFVKEKAFPTVIISLACE